jgi:hypothetical protein
MSRSREEEEERRKLASRLHRAEQQLEGVRQKLEAARSEAAALRAEQEVARAAAAEAAAQRQQQQQQLGGAAPSGGNPLLGLPEEVAPSQVGSWFQQFLLSDDRCGARAATASKKAVLLLLLLLHSDVPPRPPPLLPPRVPPEIRSLASLHAQLSEQEAALRPRRPKKHLLQRLGLPAEHWDDVAVSIISKGKGGDRRHPANPARSVVSWQRHMQPKHCRCCQAAACHVNSTSCFVLQEVNRLIHQRDQAALACSACRARYACPGCSAALPDGHALRTAFQSQHALWNVLVGQQHQTQQQQQEQVGQRQVQQQ